MKRVPRWLLLLILLLAGLLLLAAFVLRTRLTDLVRQRVLPNLEAQVGVPLTVDEVRAELFGGRAELHGLAAANPPGFGSESLFQLESAELQIAWMPLLRGMLTVRSADFQEARLNLLRLDNGDLNIRELVRPSDEKSPGTGSRPGPRPPGTESPPPGEPPAQPLSPPGPAPAVLIEALDLEFAVRYEDRTFEEPLVLLLAETLEIDGLSTPAADQAEWARIRITGHLTESETTFVTDLSGTLGPVEDPNRLSFDLTGSIGRVEGEALDRYLDKSDLRCAHATLDVDLVCRDGRFDRDRSKLVLAFEQVEPTGRNRKYLPDGVAALPRVSVPLHIGGTLDHPQPDTFFPALVTALQQNLADNFEILAKGVLEKELEKNRPKIERELKKFLGEDGAALGRALLGDPDDEKAQEAAGPDDAEPAGRQAEGLLRDLLNR